MILASEGEGIFTLKREEIVETYQLSQRQFLLNHQHHSLVLLHRLTGELGRQEAAIWKKVIRVISHELNNSLAPISSLVHSAKLVAQRPDLSHKTEEIFLHNRRTTRPHRAIHRWIREIRAPARTPKERCRLAGSLDESRRFSGRSRSKNLCLHDRVLAIFPSFANC